MASWKHRVSFGIGRISAKSSDSYRLYAQNSEQIMDEKNGEFYTSKSFESCIVQRLTVTTVDSTDAVALPVLDAGLPFLSLPSFKFHNFEVERERPPADETSSESPFCFFEPNRLAAESTRRALDVAQDPRLYNRRLALAIGTGTHSTFTARSQLMWCRKSTTLALRPSVRCRHRRSSRRRTKV